MSKTVSFRCSEELDEFLEAEAERRMTTKSTVAQMLLAEKVRELKGERAGNGGDTQSDTDVSEGVNADSLEEMTEFEMGSREKANAVREEFSEHLSSRDDRRLSRVRLAEGTPGEVVAEVQRRQN